MPTLPRCNFQNLGQSLLVNLNSTQVSLQWIDDLFKTRPALAIPCMWFKERVVGPISRRWPPLRPGEPILPVSNSKNVTSHPDKPLPSTISVERLWIPLIDLESWKWIENECSHNIWRYLTSPSWRVTILWKDLVLGDCSTWMFWNVLNKSFFSKWAQSVKCMTSWKRPSPL